MPKIERIPGKSENDDMMGIYSIKDQTDGKVKEKVLKCSVILTEKVLKCGVILTEKVLNTCRV